MRITNVKPGDTIMIKKTEYEEGRTRTRTIKELWTVVEIYPHHVLAVRNGIRECFTYGELVQLRLEKQKQKFEELRMVSHDIEEDEE